MTNDTMTNRVIAKVCFALAFVAALFVIFSWGLGSITPAGVALAFIALGLLFL